MKIQIPVVSTTHYDREWRFSLQQSRSMLVELMDHLLKILDEHSEFRCYHLDSQSVILEDYLSLRPEREADLRRHISGGRLIAGPWYSLPDMNLVAGESIIRNLLLGHRLVGAFGPVPKVGYTPTGFGHISQLPQIYNGFGIDTAMFYRGPDRSNWKRNLSGGLATVPKWWRTFLRPNSAGCLFITASRAVFFMVRLFMSATRAGIPARDRSDCRMREHAGTSTAKPIPMKVLTPLRSPRRRAG